VGFDWVFQGDFERDLENFGKMRVIMDERASARFLAEMHR